MTMLDPEWWADTAGGTDGSAVVRNSEPFSSNTVERITADQMKRFAFEIDDALDKAVNPTFAIGDGVNGGAGRLYFTATVPPPPFAGATPAGWTDAGPVQGADGQDGQDGADGADGTGVSIVGTVDDSTGLPGTPNPGDLVIVGSPWTGTPAGAQGDALVWDGTQWGNVGSIQGPAGPTAVSADAGNDLSISATDSLLFYSTPDPAVSTDADNALSLGSDGQPFFNHAKDLEGHVPHFATVAERDAAFPTPAAGQVCTVGPHGWLWRHSDTGWTLQPLGGRDLTLSFPVVQGSWEVSTVDPPADLIPYGLLWDTTAKGLKVDPASGLSELAVHLTMVIDMGPAITTAGITYAAAQITGGGLMPLMYWERQPTAAASILHISGIRTLTGTVTVTPSTRASASGGAIFGCRLTFSALGGF